jgi:undecaprenyl-phosphate galactose phosphotransferase
MENTDTNTAVVDLALQDFFKRIFDIVFSVVFLTLFSPLYFILGCFVFFSSPGPVFYKSLRLGKGGKIIGCWKFRTMYQDADVKLLQLLSENQEILKEWKMFQKIKQDPRITKIGHFLRKTSLDEFPQFWNVLKGDLSVVGPRPATLMGPPDQFFNEFKDLYGNEAFKILSIRPGITGVWQISGRSNISFEKRKEIECSYVDRHPFIQDLIIIGKTIPAIFCAEGAW